MEKFEFKGVWWLPGDEAKRVVGILKFDPEDGAHLELMGVLSNCSELDSDVVLGKTSDGKDITLCGCFQTKWTFNSSGIPTTVIFANIVFEGAHFNTKEEIEFKELSCRYTHLDEWAWMKGIYITPPTGSQGGLTVRQDKGVIYNRWESCIVKLNQQLLASLGLLRVT